MKPVTHIFCFGTLLLVGGSCTLSAQAQESAVPVAVSVVMPAPALVDTDLSKVVGTDLAGWVPVSQDTLDETRGGYDLGNGLLASFGIDRAVYVNGNLVTSTSFNVPDIAHMTTTQASAMATALNSVSLTQIGPNNVFDPSSLGKTSAASVIQNTLNGQNIQSITTLNTTVNTLNAFRQTSFQDALQQAQLQSLGH